MRAKRGIGRVPRTAAFAALAALLLGTGCDKTILEILAGALAAARQGKFVGSFAAQDGFGPLVGEPGVNRTGALLTTPTAAANAEFGTAIAIHAGTDEAFVVGAPADAPSGVATGAAYVYARIPEVGALGVPSRVLPPNGTPDGARFGESVAVTANRLVVGAPGFPPYGAAFVYERVNTTWLYRAYLGPISPAPGSRFGAAVAILDGDDPLVLVGAPDEPTGGRVDVFRRSSTGVWNWDYLDGHAPSLHPAAVPPESRFGASLATQGDRLAVGAPGYDFYDETTHTELEDAGAAFTYRFDRATMLWSAPAGAMDVDPIADGRFGTAVALGAAETSQVPERFVVGAPGPPGGAQFTGRVHLFESTTSTTSGWKHAYAATGRPGHGVSVGASPVFQLDRYAFGGGGPVRSTDENAPAGVAGLWESYGGTYQPVDVLAGPESDPLPEDTFGSAFVLAGGGANVDVTAFVGASRAGRAGAVYVFTFTTGLAANKAADGGPPPLADRYLAFAADDDATSPASAALSAGRPLRAPFRVEIAVGSFNAAKRAGLTGGSIELELAGRDAASARRATLRATFAADGLGVAAETESAPAGTTVDLSGAWIADLAADYDGATLRLEARRHGSGQFATVASVAVADAEFSPSIRIDGIGAGAEVGIDEPRVVANGAPAQGAPPAETIVDSVYAAMDRQLEAMSALDAGSAAGETGPMLEAADARLREAVVALDALLAAPAKKPASGPKAARRLLRSALREIAAAGAKAAKGKPRAAVEKRIEKAFAAEIRAIAALTEDRP